MIPWWVIPVIICIAGFACLIVGILIVGVILGGDDPESFT